MGGMLHVFNHFKRGRTEIGEHQAATASGNPHDYGAHVSAHDARAVPDDVNHLYEGASRQAWACDLDAGTARADIARPGLHQTKSRNGKHQPGIHGNTGAASLFH
jgi:hypothetical protein